MTGTRTTVLGTTIGTAVGTAGSIALAALVARRLLAPAPYRATATVRSSTRTEALLDATRDTRLPGTYGLQRSGRRERIGTVLGVDGDAVRRAVSEPVDPGVWEWDALMADSPDDVPGEEPATTARTHVVHVHGQALGPRQVLRGLAVWRSLGASNTIVDTTDLPLRSLDPAAADRIVAAVRAARADGAERVVLQGWSAGALACAVAADREHVDGIVGVAPLLSMASALRGAVRAAHLPSVVGSLAARTASTPLVCRLAGTNDPVAVTTWPDRTTPTLLLHSTADALVSADDVAAQAARAGVTAVAFHTAPHTLEWNEDPVRWDDAVRRFAAEVAPTP
ncbi:MULTISPECIES: hypothetical protein [unclassified Curtobacterium]|uniref:hypothetical protein n=1 Tax=unclassified Curtobacterium TaxID=257496 RepID=UPI0008DD431C|nr:MULTISPECIES: hypothetical protein [unclassified Curtobacterium]OIH99735.1 hypothetical protein BIU92_02350 [Curtobacterium sp. MCBA15_003]OII30429.1 hypothetical protein BIU94_06540 [Curtobacterium sp. MMLR14_006]